MLLERPQTLAREWLASARRALTQDGALPLLAGADRDEARLYVREAQLEPAARLAATAQGKFQRLGMSRWVQRAREVNEQPWTASPISPASA